MGCRIVVGVEVGVLPATRRRGRALIFIPSAAIPPATRASSTTWSAARPSAAIPPATRASSTTRSAARRPSPASRKGAALTCVCFCHLPPDDRAGFVAAGRAAGVRRSSAAPAVSAGLPRASRRLATPLRSAVGFKPSKARAPFIGVSSAVRRYRYRRLIRTMQRVHGARLASFLKRRRRRGVRTGGSAKASQNPRP